MSIRLILKYDLKYAELSKFLHQNKKASYE